MWNYGTILEQIADVTPGNEAIVHPTRRLTYAAFRDRCHRVANALHEADLRRGDHVGIMHHNTPEYLEALYGAFLGGFVPFNVNHRYVEAELAYVLDNGDARAVLFDDRLATRVEQVLPKCPQVLAAWQGGPEPAPIAALVTRSASTVAHSSWASSPGLPRRITAPPELSVWSAKKSPVPCMRGDAGSPRIRAPRSRAASAASGGSEPIGFPWLSHCAR